MNKKEFFSLLYSESPGLELPGGEKCIVIGGGPSLKRNRIIQRILKTKYSGPVIVTDYSIKHALEMGMTPDRFKKYYVCSEEYSVLDFKFYDEHPLVTKYAPKIDLVALHLHPTVEEYVKKIGFKLSHVKKTDLYKVMSNTGSMGWYIAWKILKCSKIALVGFDQGYYAEELPHPFPHPQIEELIYSKHYNQALQCEYILDNLYSYFNPMFRDCIENAPKTFQTWNCTEAGGLECNNLNYCTIEDFIYG